MTNDVILDVQKERKVDFHFSQNHKRKRGAR